MSMTPRKTLEQFEQESQQKRAELELVNKVYALLPESLSKYEVLVHTTSYTADVRIGIEKKTYPYDSPIPSAQIVRELGRIFPPIAISRHKGGCLTFVPDAMFDSWSERKQSEYKENEAIAPFLLKIDPASFSQSVQLEWFSQVADVGIVEVAITFPLYSATWAGKCNVHYQNYPGGKRVIHNNFHLSQDAYFIHDGHNEIASAHAAQPVRWSAGSDENPGEHTVYWIPNDKANVPLEAIARLIEAKEQKAMVSA